MTTKVTTNPLDHAVVKSLDWPLREAFMAFADANPTFWAVGDIVSIEGFRYKRKTSAAFPAGWGGVLIAEAGPIGIFIAAASLLTTAWVV